MTKEKDQINEAQQRALELLVGMGPKDARRVIADVFLQLNGPRVDLSCSLLERAVGEYVTEAVDMMRPVLEQVYTKLVQKGAIEKKPFEYSYTDKSAFYIPHEEKRVFCFKCPEDNFLFITKTRLGKEELHVRRYWDKFNPKVDDLKISNVKEAIRGVSELKQFSDNIGSNSYVDRPDLKWFKDINFDLDNREKNRVKYTNYGDARDKGYVLSSWINGVDRALIHLEDISYVISNVNNLNLELDEPSE